MKKFTITATTVGALAATALGVASVASAAAVTPFGGSTADTVNSLKAQGYDVQLNGVAQVPLSRCTTTSVDGLPASGVPDPTRLNTVYLTFTCPDSI
jgi:hypothetical protein